MSSSRCWRQPEVSGWCGWLCPLLCLVWQLRFRIGAAYSVMVTMISEYLMQTGGLGNMFALSSQAFETERAWGASLVAMALSVALYNAAGAVETRVRERYR